MAVFTPSWGLIDSPLVILVLPLNLIAGLLFSSLAMVGRVRTRAATPPMFLPPSVASVAVASDRVRKKNEYRGVGTDSSD